MTTFETDTQKMIYGVCNEIRELLLSKNRKYGDSAIYPVRIFSQASNKEQIRARIDDKLSRIQSDQLDDEEDTLTDLVGYLILLMVANKLEKETK